MWGGSFFSPFPIRLAYIEFYTDTGVDEVWDMGGGQMCSIGLLEVSISKTSITTRLVSFRSCGACRITVTMRKTGQELACATKVSARDDNVDRFSGLAL